MSDIESDKGSVKWEASPTPSTPPSQQQQTQQPEQQQQQQQQPHITIQTAAETNVPITISPRTSLDLFKRLNLDRFIESNLKIVRVDSQKKKNLEPYNDTVKRARLNGDEEGDDDEEEDESVESRSSSSSSLNNSCESDNNNTNENGTRHIDSRVIEMKTKELNSLERSLIDVWMNAFYSSRELVSLDFSIQPRLLSLLEFKADTEFPANIRKTCKAILANFLLKPIMRIVHFVKMLPDFGELDTDDQMSLLNGGSMELFICSATSLYDQISNKLLNLVSREANSTRSKSLPTSSSSNPSLALLQMDILKMIWNEDLFEKTITFMKSMNEMKIDETTLVLLLPIILFSPERADLKNRKLVYKIQASYSALLEKYVSWKYGDNGSNDESENAIEPKQLFNRLLLILIELRSLQQMHCMFLMDVDPSTMEYNS